MPQGAICRLLTWMDYQKWLPGLQAIDPLIEPDHLLILSQTSFTTLDFGLVPIIAGQAGNINGSTTTAIPIL
jgi:hypothetical protein